jgi:hypothetical protein
VFATGERRGGDRHARRIAQLERRRVDAHGSGITVNVAVTIVVVTTPVAPCWRV